MSIDSEADILVIDRSQPGKYELFVQATTSKSEPVHRNLIVYNFKADFDPNPIILQYAVDDKEEIEIPFNGLSE